MSTQLEDYYKTPKEVSEALKVKDLQTLIRGNPCYDCDLPEKQILTFYFCV